MAAAVTLGPLKNLAATRHRLRTIDPAAEDEEGRIVES
jgi:hypothetical protein